MKKTKRRRRIKNMNAAQAITLQERFFQGAYQGIHYAQTVYLRRKEQLHDEWKKAFIRNVNPASHVNEIV